jgi:hypothetical protein
MPAPSSKWQRLFAEPAAESTREPSAALGAILENNGRVARRREAEYFANFRHFFHSGLAVTHPHSGEVIRVDDWSRVEQIEDDLLQLGQLLKLSVLRAEQQANYPNNVRVLYWVEPNSLGGILRKYPKQGLVIECAIISRMERYVTFGHDNEKLNLTQVQQELDERRTLAQRWSARLGAPLAYIVGLASTTGWDESSIAHVAAFADNSPVSPYLIDLVTLQVTAPAAQSTNYLELFDLPLGERKFISVQQKILDLLLLRGALRLDELQAQLECSQALVRAAALQLANENADFHILHEGNSLIIRRI